MLVDTVVLATSTTSSGIVVGRESMTNEYPATPPPVSVEAVQSNVADVIADTVPDVCVGDDAIGTVGGFVIVNIPGAYVRT